MKCKEYLKIAFSELKSKNKKRTIGICCISFAILMLMLSNMFFVSLEKYKKGVESAPQVRTISFSYDKEKYTYEEIVNKIEQLNNPNITMIEEYGKNSINVKCNNLISEDSNEYLYLSAVNDKELNALGIYERFSTSDAYEIILPDKIKYSIETDEYDEENFRYIFKTEIIKCTEFLGQNIIIRIDDNEYKLKVIGTYNSDIIRNKKGYVPIDLVKELKNLNNIEDKAEYIYDVNVIVNDILALENLQSQLTTMILEMYDLDLSKAQIPSGATWNEITDEYQEQFTQYQQSFPEKFENFDYNYMPSFNSNVYDAMGITEKSVKTFNIVEIFINISAWIIIIVTLIVINIKNINESSIEYGLLKSEGFTNKDIQTIGIIRSTIITIFSIIIAVFLYLVINGGLTQILNFLLDQNNIETLELREAIGGLIDMPRSLNYIVINEIIVITILVLLSSFINNKIMIKKDIKDLMEEDKNIFNITLNKNNKLLYIVSIIILFLTIMIINNLKLYTDKYYSDVITETSCNYYEYINKHDSEMLINDIPKEKYPCLLSVNATYAHEKLTYQKIQELEKLPYIEKSYERTITFDNGTNFTSYYLLIDSWKHASMVKRIVRDNNYGVENFVKGIGEYINTYNTITMFINIAIFAVTTLIIAIFIMLISRMLEEERENIGISKAVGYSNFRIWKKMIFKTLLIIIIAYIINCIILIGINQIIDLLLESYGFSNYNEIVRNSWNINILWTFGLIAVFISIYTMIRIRKTNIIEILK